ncbi:MAG: rod shape-determining protein MreD [Lachnospiraceae bacterium]
MKKTIGQALLIIIAYALQTTIIGSAYTFYVNPNLMIILVTVSGFTYGRNNGMLVGFFSGLLCDVFFGNLLGPQAFLYMLLGYMNAKVVEHFYSDTIVFKYFMVFLTDILYANVIYFTMFFLNGKLEYTYYLQMIILPEAIYTLIILVVIYPVLSRLYKWLEIPVKKERKEDDA